MAYEVTFIQKKEIKKEKTLLEVAQKLDLPIKASCDGKGKCGKCVVRVLEGPLSEPTKEEKSYLGKDKIAEGYRLACQAVVNGHCKVELPT